PTGGDTLFSDDNTILYWNAGTAVCNQVTIALSTDGGATFTTIASKVDNSGIYRWVVPSLRSNRCILRLADPASEIVSHSNLFCITQKPFLKLDKNNVAVDIEVGTVRDILLGVKNGGKGVLSYSCEMQQPTQKVFINEIFASDIFYKYPQNGFEIYNTGADIDLSGWRIESYDNVGSNKSFTFPQGYTLKGNRCILFTRMQMAQNDSVFFYLIDWHRTLVTKKKLHLSIALFNRSGTCVDFIKTIGSPQEPPAGCSWNGPGIAIDDPIRWPSIYRHSLDNTHSAGNWSFDSAVTPNLPNKGQPLNIPKRHWLRLANAKSSLDSLQSTGINLTVDATALDYGIYVDTILISHNSRDIQNPFPFVVQMKVNALTALNNKQKANQFAFRVTPNPIAAGLSAMQLHYPRSGVVSSLLQVYDGLGDCVFKASAPYITSWNLMDRSSRRVAGGTYCFVLTLKMTDGSTKVARLFVGVKQ
ncbi:MAG: lamin tail domain-containing protein, partial [Chitinivibrionales bacterium]|nr:lamin tail domain-containing protein [Chitinivibrionales bacterium]